MQLTGEQRINAPQENVWAALNDPNILRQCIPGCVSLKKEGDDRFSAIVEVKVGPIGARMSGVVTLSDLTPPSSYRITGEGHGGMMGMAKGSANVSLTEIQGITLLNYSVDVQVGGRLAQLSGQIIDATAKQLSRKFFEKLSAILEAPETASPHGAPTETRPTQSAEHVAASLPSQRMYGSPGMIAAVSLLAILAAGLIGFLIGRGQAYAEGSDWVGLAIGLLLVLIGATGFEIGKRSASPIIVLDQALARRLGEGGHR